MNKIQACALDILIEVDAFCQNNDIQYFLGYGTLLGAVRHKGFIPWDDDIDILMLRDDYEKFCKIARDNLSLPYQLLHHEKGKYATTYAKVHNINTTFIEKVEIADKNRYKGVFIDVFPVDGVPKYGRKFYMGLRNLLMRGMTAHAVKDAKIVKLTKLQTVSCLVPYSVYFCWYQKLVKHFKIEKSIHASVCQDHVFQEKELFSNVSVYEFEGHEFPSVKDCDKYLKTQYGDYMQLPPEEKRQTHSNSGIVSTTKSFKEYIKNNTENI